MDFPALLTFVKTENQRLQKKFARIKDPEKRTFGRTIKVMEELGELCDEILSMGALQRDSKLSQRQPDNLSKEFADVVLSALLLAHHLNIDIEQALEKRIQEINQRYEEK